MSCSALARPVKTSWPTSPLAELAEMFSDGDWIESKDQSTSGIRLLQTGNVGGGEFKDRAEKARFISAGTFARLNCTEVLAGDILISRLPDPVGRACIVPELDTRMITAVDCSIVRLDEQLILPKLFVYFTQTDAYLSEVAALCTGTTRSRISRTALGQIEFPTPPMDEQKRIVAVLDQAFGALDRACANAEANLADGQALFEQVLLSTFDELLPTANMKTLAETAKDFSRGKSKHRPRNDPALYGGKYPFIQTGDVRKAQGGIREFSQSYNEMGLMQSKLWPVGTVCITIAANIADTGVLEIEACFPDSVIGMVPKPDEATPYYVEYMLRYFAEELKLKGKGSAQDNINLATFEESEFPFPPLNQQEVIVKKLNALSTHVVKLRASYTHMAAEVAALRQSLLQAAFSGQLT
ncbi:restriction endonuclease subunit S [Xanthomonas campestris]|uniref:restriction endonuclease subunit S n=2 Tax=Xanthomonas TaxID=338 RepID=UPI0024B6CEE8|nr:restriction endonuclease subunit S [Xanthomonas campestris]WHO92096.1 restriction endonuclease subunit S [Xanthomonas campestris]